MGRSLIGTGIAVFTAAFVLTAVEGVHQHWVGPGAWAGERQGELKSPRRRHARKQRSSKSGSTPEEIARYFQLFGGNIDPSLNKQTQAGPFDSGFFFNSGIGPNGGDSPYMN
jgi:hypothetical protein